MNAELPLLTDAPALDAIGRVRDASREHDGTDPVDEAVALRLKHHGLAGAGAWVSDQGFALRHDGELDLAVAPSARGHGLGASLGALAVAEPGPLTAWSHGDHPAAAALARRWGFARTRELWVMRRPSAVPLPSVTLPDGVRIRDYGDSDAEALLAVNAAAFAHHPEQGGLDAAGLAERMAEPWFDPAGLLLAVDDAGDLLGFHWTKQHDASLGEVYVVGVSPTAQGRGLGRVLTIAGLQHLAARGVAEVLLYVESDNTPARRLYEDLGFQHAAADTHVQYQRAEVARNPLTPE
ncbi:mycothiol synthase [Nocardioides nitrophenolicus]|uniref:mycothiol synthase n=1 Tax=Nocardioides nitrophenolicus TaxID=60489 RepID=UPI0027DE1F41|nr:mycothiol synthase [Nocardioides nitrophenolicus]MBM7516596.1 mycothiol synthase [Nocardioides nitrophenolicus]